jgi:hypothetical protein
MRVAPPTPTRLAEHVLWGLRHPLRAFLWTLLALFALRPALDGTPYLYVVDTLFVMLVVAALRALVASRALLVGALIVVALTVASRIAGDVEALRWLAGSSSALSAALVGLLLVFLFSKLHVLNQTVGCTSALWRTLLSTLDAGAPWFEFREQVQNVE